jgi:hypothetical protein
MNYKVDLSWAIHWVTYLALSLLFLALALFWLLRKYGQTENYTPALSPIHCLSGFYQQPNALTYKQLLFSYAAAHFTCMRIHVLTQIDLESCVLVLF